MFETDSEEDIACAAAAYVLICGEYLNRKPAKRRRRCWMVSSMNDRKRYNASDMLMNLRNEPSGRFENFCRMSATEFENLLCKIGPIIAKQDTKMRKCIPVQERLAFALRFFSTGDSYTNLSHLFKCSIMTVSKCIDEVCKAINQELQDQVKLPQGQDMWLKVAEGYEKEWNFPNCLGAIDGRHIIIQRPTNASTDFLDYKWTLSIVLLVVVDAHYCFRYVDIGCQDRTSDGGIFNYSALSNKLLTDKLKLPADRQLPSTTIKLPYVFISNSAFPLSSQMMKPYPGVFPKGSKQKTFNYRLSRARRVVENVFGIMASVFRVFRKPILLEPEKASNITLACVLLHNWMSSKSLPSYTPPGTFDTEVDGKVIPGSWRNDQNDMSSFVPLKNIARKPGKVANTIRNSFANYFMTRGKLPFQDQYC